MDQPAPLSQAEKKELRGIAQRLKAHLHIGKNGLSETVVKEIDIALTKNGLIKLKFETDRALIKSICDQLIDELNCEYVGGVGKTAILFREMPEN